MTEQPLLSIGEVAAAAAATVSAVRYYDELGLIAAKDRVGGKRRFDASTIPTVKLIREMQQCGFSLAAIGAMLGGDDWRSAVDEKLEELVVQRGRIDEIVSTLREIRDCGCRNLSSCERLAETFG